MSGTTSASRAGWACISSECGLVAGCGYTPGSIKHVLTLAGQLGRWVDGPDVKFSQLDSAAVDSFQGALRARGMRRFPGPRGLRSLLDYLDSEKRWRSAGSGFAGGAALVVCQ